MTVLFGTKEYFELELKNVLENQCNDTCQSDNLNGAYELLVNELAYDFICDDEVKGKLIKNLESAFQKVSIMVY
ncbi:hypothetical protein A8F94_15495 [Bacillus sp. FJAT-27225]|uniref:hypothetical protein n=1 Tax=Bacillus sp. FJAT-27225 TaxID=1743144 RepID=UPI00080C351C|nr:hypothetical protein [Bacillus sp. FJAT-27225]OCA84125.1 hypothetical protein A8F94_15495 [Bacillus sp. FJAT-27225]